MVKNIFKKKKKQQSIFDLKEVIVVVLTVAILSSVVTGYLVYKLTASRNSIDELKDISDTYNDIIDNYYTDVDKAGLIDAAVKGMLDYLDETYSEFLTEDEKVSINDKLNGTYSGIGVRIFKSDNKFVVLSVFDDSPASRVGIEENDVLFSIQGIELNNDTTMDDLANLIDITKESVDLVVLRNDEKLPFTVYIETLNVPVVSSKVIDNSSIGYLKLGSFSSTSTDQFKKALEKLEGQDITSLIIDLRSNTGGYLTSAKDIASLFLKKDKIIYYLENKSGITKYKDKTNESRNYPVVILVNGSTASASEVLTAALKESYGATVVGTKTYGKGKVQQKSDLSDNSMIKYTIAKWLTPSGNCIDGVGIEPGINIELSDEYLLNKTESTDNQLQTAINFINK